MLNAEEIRAVKYYEGDIPAADAADPFWGDPKAYVSLNALLFDGLHSECTRIREGKRLNPAVLSDIPRLLRVFAALRSAAKKGAQQSDTVGYRVERAADFSACAAAGQTLAFTSTCLDGFLSEYGDKRGIVLMTFRIPAGTPCMIFRALLDSYRKDSENELLLPPALTFTCTARPLTAQEQRITDLEGAPPCAAYDLDITGIAPAPADAPPLPESCEAGVRIWTLLNAGTPESALPADDLRAYLTWKRALRPALISGYFASDTDRQAP